MNCDQLRQWMMDYLYDELAEDDRRLLEAHLMACPACQQQVAALRQTSTILQQWEDVDPDFHVVMVAPKRSYLARVKQWFSRPALHVPRLALGFGAALIVGLLVLAIANTEISYRSGEFSFRTGLFPRPQQSIPAEPILTQQTIERLQQENYFLMTRLIQQSEARQRQELATNLLKLKRDLERQRLEDLHLVGLGLEDIEQKTVKKIERTDRSLNEFIRLISSQPR